MVRQSTCQPEETWAVLSYRAGENSQILGLAEALDKPFETKRLSYRRLGAFGNLTRRVGLFGIDQARSSPLAPPWPTLIISAGLRNEPVCRWIAEQSGGRTKLVFLGRTWTARSEFDLVITTPQYRLPDEQGVLQNLGTLHGVSTDRLASEASRWAPLLNPENTPCIAILIGGRSGPYTFGKHAAKRLARLADARALPQGATLLITSSARTQPSALHQLQSHLRSPAQVHRFGAGENPYFGMLALAKEIIVTGDSIAMLSEAVATGKPVWIFDLGTGSHAMNKLAAPGPRDRTLKTELYGLLMRIGPERFSRDLPLVHERFVAEGLAAWLEEGTSPALAGHTGDMERAVSSVRELLAQKH